MIVVPKGLTFSGVNQPLMTKTHATTKQYHRNRTNIINIKTKTLPFT